MDVLWALIAHSYLPPFCNDRILGFKLLFGGSGDPSLLLWLEAQGEFSPVSTLGTWSNPRRQNAPSWGPRCDWRPHLQASLGTVTLAVALTEPPAIPPLTFRCFCPNAGVAPAFTLGLLLPRTSLPGVAWVSLQSVTAFWRVLRSLPTREGLLTSVRSAPVLGRGSEW